MFSIPTVLSLDYRALHQKHQDGEFKWYVTPILGVTYHFSVSRREALSR
jgi:hypothetical protein